MKIHLFRDRVFYYYENKRVIVSLITNKPQGVINTSLVLFHDPKENQKMRQSCKRKSEKETVMQKKIRKGDSHAKALRAHLC
jgi:hypothetical protein